MTYTTRRTWPDDPDRQDYVFFFNGEEFRPPLLRRFADGDRWRVGPVYGTNLGTLELTLDDAKERFKEAFDRRKQSKLSLAVFADALWRFDPRRTPMGWLGFVNTHANAITAIATVVLTITTMVYAWLTSVLARENRRLRKEGSEPQVVAMLLPDLNELVVMNLVFANIGRGAAYDVRFSLEFDQEDFAKHKVILQWVAAPPA